MSDLITALTSLFTFLTTQMTSIATFFTTSIIGQIILGIAIFSVVFRVILSIVNKIR